MTTPAVIGTPYWIVDLDDQESVNRLCSILLYRQQTGKWPPVPVNLPEPPSPPVVIPPVVTPPSVVRKVRVKVGMSGWVKVSPDPNTSSVKLITNASGSFAILASQQGWEKISWGWLPVDVLEYVA